MIEGQPSRTAQGAAMHRAAHQFLDRPLILEDPLAMRIIGAEAAETVQNGQDWHVQPRAKAMRAMMAARSRFAEDCLRAAYRRGVRQYVVLGAGLDTFAYRSELAGLQVFEIDHPATQAWKRERLVECGLDPANAVYAPVDFEHETIVDGLKRAGFDFAKPAVFAWLGVTVYLTPDTVLATLRLIAGAMAAGSEVVFDFAVRPEGDAAVEARRAFAERVAALGEPVRSDFVPEELARDIRTLGFSKAEVIDRAALSVRYFQNRSDGLVLRHGHMMHARL